MARFTPSLHPRGRDGKFVKKGGGGGAVARKRRTSAPKRFKSSTKANVGAALSVYQSYGDIKDVASHGAKAAAYGATGNYVRSALHGAKASTATARLGSRAATGLVKVGVVKPKGGAKKFYAAQAKFDDRVQTIDNIATIGLFVTGGSLRTKSSKGAASGAGRKGGSAQRDYFQRKNTMKPARRNRQGVYQITQVKKTTSGARVRR